jgi:hypothetical protein
MTITLTRGRLAAITVLLATVLLGGIAHAITSAVFRYSSAQTGYLSLNPMAFAPDSSNTAAQYIISNDNINGGGCVVTGINLPDSAQLKGITIWGESSVGSKVSAQLWRVNVATGAALLVSEVTVLDTSGDRSASANEAIPAGNRAIINNRLFGYGLHVCVPGNSVFHSARITYTYTSAGD